MPEDEGASGARNKEKIAGREFAGPPKGSQNVEMGVKERAETSSWAFSGGVGQSLGHLESVCNRFVSERHVSDLDKDKKGLNTV